MSPPTLVIFGATVRPDGTPSLALERRLRFALAALAGLPDACVLCSGAAAASGPSEAAVMLRWLVAAGIARQRLIVDEASRDTLETALAAARFLRARGQADCFVCSDAYHLPRIRLLLGALGIRSMAAPTPARLGRPPWRHLVYMALRELVATPYDLILVLMRRSRP